MKAIHHRILIAGLFLLVPLTGNAAQDEPWTLDACIAYALDKNIQVRQAGLSNERNQLYIERNRAGRLPSLQASVSQNFNWARQQDIETGSYGDLKGSGNTGYSLSSNVQLFNGLKLNNQIKQSELNLQEGQYYSEAVKESVELNILDAYLQVLYARESITNSERQVEATSEELGLAEERLALGLISRSDYLQIKSELASEALVLVNAESDLTMARINLMQLMELPVNDSFSIATPELGMLLDQQMEPAAGEVYRQALEVKPQIKQAAVSKESARMEEKIARADLFPSLSLNAGVGTGFSSLQAGYFNAEQLGNQVNPYVGLSLSIPIFQKKQVSTNIGIARIGVAEAELAELETRNELRKDIEQATANVVTAQEQFRSSQEEYNVTMESYEVASEKFTQGLMNSVDFLFEKTNLIVAESQLLQAKYNLIFSYKVLDFYKGKNITL
jgi:outer membrane protein